MTAHPINRAVFQNLLYLLQDLLAEPPSFRANQVLGFDAEGDLLMYPGTSSGGDVAATFLSAPVNSQRFRTASLLTFDAGTGLFELVPMPPSLIISNVLDRTLVDPTYASGYYRLKASDWMNGPIVVSIGGTGTSTVTIGLANMAINKEYEFKLNNCIVLLDPGAFGIIRGPGVITGGQMVGFTGYDTFRIMRITSTGFLLGAVPPVFPDFGNNGSGTYWYQQGDGKYILVGSVTVNGSGSGGFDLPGGFVQGSPTDPNTTYIATATAFIDGDTTDDGSVYVKSQTNGTVGVKNTFTVDVVARVVVYNLTKN